MSRLLAVVVVLLLVVPTCLYAQCELDFVVEKYADVSVSKAGHDVTFTVVIVNLGSCEMMLGEVNDTLAGDLLPFFPPTPFPPGAGAEVSYVYTVQEGDPDPLVNTVMVVGMGEDGTSLEAAAEVEVDLVHPAFDLLVECASDPVPPGEPAEFHVMVANVGDVSLIVTTSVPEMPGPFTLDIGDVYDFVALAECIEGEVCLTAEVVATLPPELELDNVYEMTDTDCCPCGGSPAEEHSWGQLKALYRGE